MNNQHIHTMEYYSVIKKNEGLIHAQHKQTLKTLCQMKEASQKGRILYSSIYIKCPEQANLQR